MGKRMWWFCMVVPFLLGACAAVIPPTITVNYSAETPTKDVTGVIASVLLESDFTIAVANEKLGIITTDWRGAMGTDERVALGVLTALTVSPYQAANTKYDQRVKISTIVNKDAGAIIIKPVKQGTSNGTYWQDINLDDGDREFIRKITRQIVLRLGGDVDMIRYENMSAYKTGR